MYYQDVTVWTVIKWFLLGWLAAGAVLVLISCVRYRQCIAAAIANNTWAWINAVMPIGILIFPGTGIQDNLADKARKLGIPVYRFGTGGA